MEKEKHRCKQFFTIRNHETGDIEVAECVVCGREVA
jgi:Zn ribbon nucleic-acid-binding protein